MESGVAVVMDTVYTMHSDRRVEDSIHDGGNDCNLLDPVEIIESRCIVDSPRTQEERAPPRVSEQLKPTELRDIVWYLSKVGIAGSKNSA